MREYHIEYIKNMFWELNCLITRYFVDKENFSICFKEVFSLKSPIIDKSLEDAMSRMRDEVNVRKNTINELKLKVIDEDYPSGVEARLIVYDNDNQLITIYNFNVQPYLVRVTDEKTLNKIESVVKEN